MKTTVILLVLISCCYSIDQDFDGRILVKINQYRIKHQVNNLTWDEGLANNSATWAAKCANNKKLVHSHPMKRYGESLYFCWGPRCKPKYFAERPPLKWHHENKYYDWANIVANENATHLTQMIWKDTTTVGCGYSNVATGKTQIFKYFVVCRYAPPGNWRGEYKKNIFQVLNSTTVEK